VKKYLKPSYEGIKHSPYKKKGVMHDDCYKKKVIDEILLRDKCSKVFFIDNGDVVFYYRICD
jgi:hypothetical protein